ncbi:organic cation transporter protein-like [Ptychodera flava]|uniref:organic cation transporter protein-like n=1 Tax=Ptychodera flava TaxID=63121 RepID=UPI00396A4BEE
MEVDEAYTLVGECGCYHLIVYFLICVFGQVISVWHVLGITFLGGTPSHLCHVPEGVQLNESIPVEADSTDGQHVYSSCLMYENYTSASNNTVSCTDGWEYDPPDEITIVTEWDLVCDKSAYVDISQAVFMSGVMIGSVTFGQLSDIFGRKPVWLFSIWTQLVFAVGVAFTQNYISFTVVRFFVGFIEQGVDITSYVMVTEMFTPRWRTYAGINLTLFWASGIMLLPLMAYYIRNWRYLQLAISIPAVLSIPLWWIIPESIRWLMSKGRFKDAEKTLRRIGKYHGVAVPENAFTRSNRADDTAAQMCVVSETRDTTQVCKVGETDPAVVELRVESDRQQDENGRPSETKLDEEKPQNKFETEHDAVKNSKKYNLIDLFRTPNLRKFTLVMIFVWLVNSLVYYGLSLNTDLLAGNRYLNFFLSGAVEIPAYILSAIIVSYFGRRIPLCIFHVVGGIACIITGFIPEETSNGTDLTPLIVTVAMIGKFGIAGSFAIVFLYSTELFPTVIRNLGVGVSSFSSRVGGILAPLTMFLGNIHPALPLVVFGVLSSAAGLLVLLLPETKGKSQPQNIEDVEKPSER